MNSENKMTLLDKAQTMLIRYPRFEELHQSIQECVAMSRQAGEPHCLSLEGVTGAGKSTLIRTYPVSYTHLRAHETVLDLVCRLLLEKNTHQTDK